MYERSKEAEQITQLRKSDPPQLQEAYRLAKSLYNSGNREDTFLSAYTWVLYDCLKRYLAEGTKFYKDPNAFKVTLAQIREFPLESERDSLFVDKLTTTVRTVGWDLRKSNVPGLKALAEEVCKWPRGSVLYNADIARVLLIGLKSDDEASALVLNWLGLRNASWAGLASCSVDPNVLAQLDETARLAILWAAYDDLKDFAGDAEGRGIDLPSFLRCLSLIRVVDPGSWDSKEVVSYAVGKLVGMGWNFRRSKNAKGLEMLLREAICWSRESAMHDTRVLEMFFAGLKESPWAVITLAQWYGLTCFSRADFEQRQVDGETYPSLAQSVVKAYLDALLANDASGNPLATTQQKNQVADEATALLENDQCKEWVWESYSLGNLLTDVGRFDEARNRLARIVTLRPNEFWAWAAYGKAWKSDSPESYEKCLFKALTCAKDTRMSLGVHEDAMDLFADKGMYDCAKAEADIIEKCREENGWKPSSRVEKAKEASWYSGSAAEEMDSVYEKLSSGAEDVLAEGLPWTEFYVEWLNKDEEWARLVIPIDKDWRGQLSYNRVKVGGEIASAVKLGGLYRGHSGPDKKTIVGRIEECPEAEIGAYFIGNYTGDIDLIENFAFIRGGSKNVWVSPSLLDGLGAKQYQKATGTCRKVYLKDKGWQWNATSIELGEEPPANSVEQIVEGEIEITSRGFGFVDCCFVPASLIREAGIHNYEEVRLKEKKKWDGKKNRWGWTAVEAIQVESYAEVDDSYAEINERYERQIAQEDPSYFDDDPQ